MLAWLLTACAQQGLAPVSDRSLGGSVHRDGKIERSARGGIYRVQRGDTLYSIAWRFGLDFRALARANGIGSDYLIYPGQQIRLVEAATPKPAPPAKKKPAPAAKVQATPSAPGPKSSPAPRPTTRRTAPAAPASAKSSTAQAAASPRPAPAVKRQAAAPGPPLRWQWPASGRVLHGFSSRGKINNGIDIAGHAGAPVFAAADGRVVYAGNSLRGYGNLIIINHDEQYLSAYAHNRRLLVREGEQVRRGQKIAEMGDSDAVRVMLHFEIRKDGKPVNPLRYLPRR